MKDRSDTPSPARGHSRSRSPSPKGHYGGRQRDLLASLFVRNLPYDCRANDLSRPFDRFGPLKDIYLPKDFHTGGPRGFGYVEYVDPADAAEAKYHMDGQIFHGRKLAVVFAEENRKKPADIRAREGKGRSRFHDRRRSPPRYFRSSPRRTGSRSRNHDSSSPPRKQRDYSRSVSPQYRRHGRESSYPRQGREASYSRSPPLNGLRSQSTSPPVRGRSRTRYRNRTRTQSRSPTRSRNPKS